MNHRHRRWVLASAVVVVLAAFGALAYVGSHRNHPVKKTTSSVTHTTAAAHTSPSQPRTTTATTKPKTKPKPTTPPTTTTQIVAIQTTAATATYPAPSSSYQLNVTASTQPCWIQATSSATGTTLWAGTIQTGDSQIIQGSGTVILDLGASGSVVTLNGLPVVFPTPQATPFEATFTPGAAATTPTTAPTSGTTATTG
jgi:hypothetical protein